MFFILSKLLGVFLNPITFFLTALIFCGLAYWLGFHKFARVFTVAIVMVFVLCAYTQFPDYLLQKLETIQDPSVLGANEATYEGIIILGGAVSTNKQNKKNWYHTNQGAERIIEGIHLAKKFPNLPVLYTGGNGSLIDDGSVETDGFILIVERLGGLKNEILLEKRSKNTRQNAKYSAELIRSKAKFNPEGSWLLVTSAFHMKRSIAAFRKEGVKVIQWPTDFRANILQFPWISTSPSRQLKKLKIFLHEAIGLIAYAFVGSQPTRP